MKMEGERDALRESRLDPKYCKLIIITIILQDFCKDQLMYLNHYS